MQRPPTGLVPLLLACLVLVACTAKDPAPAGSGPESRATPGPSASRPVSPSVSPSVSPPASRSVSPSVSPSAGRPRSFAFAAAGDLGANPHTAAMLSALDRSDAEFFLALGDLDYDQTPTDEQWCGFVRSHLPRKGPTFPFELVVGNHEADGGPDGRIADFARCLPDRLGSTTAGGRYGAQYAFDYPRTDPYARFVLVAPEITADGHTYDYEPGTPDRRWLVDQVRGARRDGIRWVVVGLHYPCLSTGASHGCDSGASIANLLLAEHVDLVLAGHNHIYERSKQLRLSADGCPAVEPEQYDAGCVEDTGADRAYTAGRGTVQVTAGAVRREDKGVDTEDGDVPFFAVMDGRVTGYMSYVVTPTRLSGRWVGTSGTLRDSFSIVAR